MKRKLLLSSAVIPAMLASGVMGQVVNFHDDNTDQLSFPGVGYNELFAGQGAYADPGNNIWNGFCDTGYSPMYGSTFFYSAGPNGGGPFPQQVGNPGNPYAAYNGGGGWITSTGASLFNFNSGSPTVSGNATSSGQFTGITLSVGNYAGDNGLGNGSAFAVPNGTPSFLLGEAAVANGGSPNEVFTLQNVPAGTYGLYLYAANEGNNRGTLFSVSSGTAHNGIAATLNNQISSPAQTFVEGQNFVIFQNVTPNGSGKIIINAVPNPLDGSGNSNLGGETDVNGFQLIFNPPPTAVGSTAAQNVLAGGMASFSFSPAFASSPSFRWQFIKGGVTNILSDGSGISGSGTTNLTIANASSANVGLYQCVISTATATNTSPAAPLTILTSTGFLKNGDATNVVGGILQPGDALSDFNNSLSLPYNSIPPAFDMSVTNVEDGTLYQYVNFGGNGSTAPFAGPVGFTVTPQSGSTVVIGIRFYTSSSHPEDDPADYTLLGSNDGGTNFTPIATGPLSLPPQRNAAGGPINVTNQVLYEVDFPNSLAYTTYELAFTNVNDNDTASNGVQLAEVQLLGSLPPVGPGLLVAPNATNDQLEGTTLNASLVASGPGPLTYQWSYNSQTISGATNAILTVTNLQTTNAGTYSVIINNPYGATNAALVLNVVAPSPYEQALLAYNPLGYWPLNESNGTVAYDYVKGYNGAYINPSDVLFAQAGVPYVGFGSNSLCDEFFGGYVDIPEGPFNITSNITIMGWVQLPYSPGKFCDMLGHGDSSYRITVNPNDPGFADGTDSGDATSGTSIEDSNWHFVAGVYAGGSGATANGFLYVDGVLVASNMITGVPGSAYDLWIAGAPDYGAGRIFEGNLCHMAVIPAALSAAQIGQLFGAAGAAPVVTLPGNVITVDENGNGTITSSATGAVPLYYQWYYLNQMDDAIVIPGATNSALQLTNIQLIQAQYSYFVVVSNAYGATTSSTVVLNILTGPPVVVADLSPLLVEVPVGVPVTFSVVASGTLPFTYQWSNGVAAIAGATNSSYAFNALPGSNSYSVGIANVDGSTPSSTAVVVGLTNPPFVISFSGNGADWTTNEGATISASFSNNVLKLTDGNGSEATSAFYDYPQYIGGFLASFIYQAGGNKAADGVTFCLEDSAATTNAVGAGGGSLGYAGITNSAALEFNLYSGDHGGQGITFGTNGNVPDNDAALGDFLSTSPVALDSGDPISVQVYYGQDLMTVWLTDEVTSKTFSTSFSANLPAILGSSVGYVGFTGATGGATSIQTISNFMFSYTEPPVLAVTKGTAGSVIVSWPIGVASAFVLQQATALNGVWTNVPTTPQNVNLQNQVTLTPGTAAAFYRLSLE
jgi:hypothetical protein